MNRLRAIVIDDEQNNLDNLSQLLATYCPGVEVVATAQHATAGIAAILQYRPDLLFLDIQMPGKNGFELLKELPQYDFEVIFVTAYDQYAIQAVRFAAVDYLLKPVNINELQAAVARATVNRSTKQQNRHLENLLQLLQQQNAQHRIALATLKETRFVPVCDIVHCESSNNYTVFQLAGGERLTVSKPIYEYEELLKNYRFIRCHQSHLVNLGYVKSWVKDNGGYLLLENGHEIPVSRNKKELVALALGNNGMPV
ncbi:LytR/AlgR family response regulator transcription factor [Deminuibacter soli]|uniref:DNA-binding response regulator n=1 Tax=Deminuibacter soli TaxID=2291815 RepID=A0A3E1NFR5_9BACT|nr:LytTR family DNA-binding domain-containing protein [Deminuibacter soli]RFM26815.1 DNA-binding response regulator [Deminuibacter soli]